MNDRVQLFEAEKRMHRRIRAKHQRNGVTVRGGALIDDSVEIEIDVHVDTNAVLRGATRLAEGVHVGVGAVLVDVVVGKGTVIKPYSVLEKSRVGAGAQIGPFAHLRPDTELADEVHVPATSSRPRRRAWAQGRQGEPPLVPRRRHHRRARGTSGRGPSSATTTA